MGLPTMSDDVFTTDEGRRLVTSLADDLRQMPGHWAMQEMMRTAAELIDLLAASLDRAIAERDALREQLAAERPA